LTAIGPPRTIVPMMRRDLQQAVARRSFLSRIGGGIAALGAWGAGSAVVSAQTQAPAAAEGGHWQPARHAVDDWLEQLPGKHRLAFDTMTPDRFEDAIQFAGNFYMANKNGYGLENGELAVVIVMRHRSAPFAYSDAIWAKYGGTLAKRAEFTDPKTKDAPKVNYFTPTVPEGSARPRGIASLIKLGVQFAICDLSTHGISSLIARDHGITAEAAYKELSTNLIGNGRLVPAGIVAVNRAQERGYAIA
jgi:intracellular sulfur oxidation DsrE/DsrF family protein